MAEIWITANPADTGARSARRFGTKTVNIGVPAPLDGSTRAKLEAILIASNEGDTIHFLPGTYFLGPMGTYDPDANLNPKSWKLFGSGMYTTTLKLVGCASDGRHSMFTDPYVRDCDGMEFHDLTIDCDTTGQIATSVTNQGISISGKNILCRRVRVINSGTYNVGAEAFPLQLFAYAGDLETNNVIDSCIVESPTDNQLDGITAISISPAAHNGTEMDLTCIIQNSKVDFTGMTGSTYGHAFTGPQVRYNVAYNIRSGIYMDTWNHLIFHYHDNYLNVLRHGIDWNIEPQTWEVSESILVERNTIFVEKQIPTSTIGIRFYGEHWDSSSRQVPEITIRENYIDMTPDLLFSGLRIAGADTASVYNNVLSEIDFYNVGTSSISGNLDPDGNPVNAWIH